MLAARHFSRSVAQIAIRAMSTTKDSGRFALSKKYHGLEKNVWIEYAQLAADYQPVNLGQGFPDYPVPDYVYKGLANVATDANVLLNQYTRGFGHPRLVKALSVLYSKLIGRQVDAMNEFLITVGAYEALFCAIMGNVNEGDEVVVIEPYYDSYEPNVRLAGGIPVCVPLRPKKSTGEILSSSDWVLDREEFTAAFNSKTKMVIVNSPHNPTGKVFSRDELEFIASLAKKWDAICLMDEVYEWLVYEGSEHHRLASFPDMWDRTITIGSAGKTFSVTGWKLGWAYGPPNLIRNMQIAHQHCLYTCPTPTQEAVARCFELEIGRLGSSECYFNSLSKELIPKRDYMAKFLLEAGMAPTVPEGGYFMMANWSKLAGKLDLSSEKDPEKDYRFTKWMSKNKKIQGIPPTAFYSDQHKALGEDFIRFCFFKDDALLKKAEKILREWKL